MSTDSFVGPPVTVGEDPAVHPLMMPLLIQLARAVAFQDAIKEKTGEAKIGDLVVEMSSFRQVPDPTSIGWLRETGVDDFGGQVFFIEPLFGPVGTEWVSWGNASFRPLHQRHWFRLGLTSWP